MSSHFSSDTLPSQRPATEPDGDLFLDRGSNVPDRYAETRLRTLIRDPHTLHIYWQLDAPEGAQGWHVEATAHGAAQPVALTADLGTRRVSLNLSTLSGGNVVLRAMRGGQPAETLLEVRFGQAPAGTGPERWLEVTPERLASGQSPRVVSGPPLGWVEVDGQFVHPASLNMPTSR